MKKTYTTPGVFIGLSLDRAFKGKSVIVRVDDEPKLEVCLGHPFPTEITEVGTLPGLEEERFFKQKLVIEYPTEVEGHLEIFVSQ